MAKKKLKKGKKLADTKTPETFLKVPFKDIYISS